MNSAILIIKDEHISISSVLKGLVSHVEEAKAGERTADPHLIAAMLDYIETVPEKLHHPKEDEFLFRLLRLRTELCHEILDELEAEHVQTKQLVKDMRLALAEFKKTDDIVNLASALGQYAKFHFSHMRKEEKTVIPMAEKYLTPEDWAEIDAAFAQNLERDW